MASLRVSGATRNARVTAASPRLLLLLLLPLLAPRLATAAATKDMTCEPITVPMCRDVGYNLTHMPNQFHHYSQEEVGLEVHQFWPLVRIRCSPDLLFFLCSVYTPICIPDYRRPLPPCRAVCERAKRGCSPLMRQYGFQWPDRMSCERLPELGDPLQLCMDRNASDDHVTTTAAAPSPPPPSKAPPHHLLLLPAPPRRRPAPPPRDCNPECPCRPSSSSSSSSSSWRRDSPPGATGCSAPCVRPHLTANQQAFTRLWLGLWAGLCFLSTAATLATFLMDRQRFKYPELPIVYLAACSLCVAAGYLLRLAAGHRAVACGGADGAHALSRGAAAGSPLCMLVFLLLYFFGMAGAVWWLLLSLTWYLAAGLKWSSEAIAGYAHYYHLTAWLLPSGQTVAVLALGAVDGDAAVGVCYVGSQSPAGLRGLVLAPLLLYLLAGSGFLLAGFVSLFRIRSVIKRGGGGGGGGRGALKTQKLERLMVRLGLFTVLYMVPAVAVVTCLAYEQHLKLAACSSCRAHPAARHRRGRGAGGDARPEHAVLMLKHFMTLVVGVTSGVWVWSGKTLEAWNRVLTRWCVRPAAAATAARPSDGSTCSEASSALTHRTAITPSSLHAKSSSPPSL